LEIPVQAVSPDQLPAEKPIKWDDICRIVGNLYLDSYQRVSAIEDHARGIMAQYADRINDLTQENGQLKKALEDAGRP